MAGAAALLLAVGCGSTGSMPAPGGSSAPPSAGAQLTNQDSGRTVSMRVGATVEVALSQESGFGPWANVRSSNPAVLQPVVDVHAAAVRGMTLAMFRAIAPGQADIDATATPDCSPGVACPAIARAYKVTVVVGA